MESSNITEDWFKTPNYFVDVLGRQLVKQGKLTKGEAWVLVVVTRLIVGFNHTECRVSVSWAADWAGCTRAFASNTLNKLVDLGCLEYMGKKKRTKVYRIATKEQFLAKNPQYQSPKRANIRGDLDWAE
jgi:hypothetical protein